MQFLLMLHSIVRWLIVLVGVIALIKFAVGWLRGGTFKGMDRGLGSGFSGLMDLQAALGLVFLLWNGWATDIGFPRFRIEHMGIMIVAVIIGHLQSRWKNADDRTRFGISFLLILAALLVVFLGVASLPEGWNRG